MHKIKFLLAFVLPLSAVFGFTYDGWSSVVPLILIFLVFPLLEFLLPLDRANLSEKMTTDEKNERFYDWLLYLAVPVYLLTFVYFFKSIATTPFGTLEFWCRIGTMGLICGIFGFNIGHELSHRTNHTFDYLLSQINLLTVLNLHFILYHAGGHHRNVGKPTDPSTAQRGEWLYTFWFRSQIGGYFQAWELEKQRLQHLDKTIFSWHNRMIQYSLATIGWLVALYLILDAYLFFLYLVVVAISIALLETINYIEHYGLIRHKNEKGIYEPVRHHHSWNSDHLFGRALMFNLSRHSDHHYNGSTKYQALKSLPNTPQMPTGYPGMVMLALLPPAWFWVMDKRLENEY